jgi:hypothetical protein
MNRRAIALTVDPVRPLLDLSGWCRASEESDKLASMVGSRGRRTGICGRGWSAWHSGARSRKCGQTSGADRISDLSEFAARPVSRGRSGHAGRRSDQVGELRDGLPLAYVAILVHSPVVACCCGPPRNCRSSMNVTTYHPCVAMPPRRRNRIPPAAPSA